MPQRWQDLATLMRAAYAGVMIATPPHFLDQPIRAVVFDLDGTLIDSAPDLAHAVNAVLDEDSRDRLTLAQVRRFIGDGARVLVDRAMAETGDPLTGDALDSATRRFLDHYGAGLAVDTRMFAGATEMLSCLKVTGLAIGICTNKPQTATESVLAHFGLIRWVDAIGGGDRFPVRKPQPGHLEGVLRDLGVLAHEAVMVGDNEHDMAVARAVGTGSVLVSWGYARQPLGEIDADRRIDHLAELPSLLGVVAASTVDNPQPAS